MGQSLVKSVIGGSSKDVPQEGTGQPDPGKGAPAAPAAPGTAAAAFNGKHAGGQQYTVEEALAIYYALKIAFADPSFQTSLRRAEALHPKRGHRGHADQQAFMDQLSALLLKVFRKVLPQSPWCLEAGWEGYRQLTMRVAPVAEDPKVVQARTEMNRLLGLPGHTQLRPPSEEPVVRCTPDGTGNVPMYEREMFTDADGDAAHEFWEEDRAGQLRRTIPHKG